MRDLLDRIPMKDERKEGRIVRESFQTMKEG